MNIIYKKHCKRCGKEIIKTKVQFCDDCKMYNKRAIMAIHNGLCCGTFTIISDPSEYSIESGLVLSGEEVKYMLINGSFTENTIIERGKFRYKVIGNTTRSKRFLQRIVPL